MSIYLVTGGAGFIGSHIVEELVKRGESVRVLDNFMTGKRENLQPFFDDIDLIEGDIRDMALCRKAVNGVDYVLHQAALPSVPRSVENPVLTHEINATGTLNLLTAAKDEGVKAFVFASSSSVYGADTRMPKVEGEEGTLLSPYAVSKMTGEKYCQVFHELFDFNAICLRYFNVFGPRQDPTSQYAAAVPLFITRMMDGRPPIIYGDGAQSRDFTYVKNIVHANLLAAQSSGAGGEIMNTACHGQITVNTLVETIKTKLGVTNLKSIYEPPRPGDIKHSFADISKARRLIAYEPIVSFDKGLENTINWYKHHS
ncbi:MAG: SDR family oxidoreductase [Pseudomonadota bacterium]